MQNYHSSHNAFPPAKIYAGSCNGSNGGQGLVLNTTAFTMILPQLEQTVMANAYNFSQASSGAAWRNSNTNLIGSPMVNTTVVGTVLTFYACPSDDVPEIITTSATDKAAYSRQFACRSNYLVNSAYYTDYDCIASAKPSRSYQGAFYSDISTAMRDFKDGSSNTLLVGESIQIHSSTSFGPYWGSGTHTSTHGRILPPNNASVSEWMPNGRVIGSTTPLPYAWVFSSAHPGGINTVFADGSVKFIKDSISPYAWWAVATIRGGEVLSSSSYQ